MLPDLFVRALVGQLVCYHWECDHALFPIAVIRVVRPAFPLYTYLIGEFDADGDSVLSQAEIDSVKFIDVEYYDETTDQYFGLGITDLTGIKNFKNLNGLLCRNNQLTKLDVSGCTKLSTLCCDNNQLTELNVSGCYKLSSLSCSNNQLTELNIQTCTRLTDVECNNNHLAQLNTTTCRQLEWLECKNNQLAELNLGNNPKLELLYCDGNQLTTLNVKDKEALYRLTCSNNKLTTLDASGLNDLQYLNCSANQLTTLNASNDEWIYTIDCRRNQLKTIDVRNNKLMYALRCDHNQLTTLDISTSPDLIEQIGKSVRQEKDGVITFSQYHFSYSGASDRSVAHLTCDVGVDVKGVDINMPGRDPEDGPFRIKKALAETSADGYVSGPLSAFRGEKVEIEISPEEDTEFVGLRADGYPDKTVDAGEITVQPSPTLVAPKYDIKADSARQGVPIQIDILNAAQNKGEIYRAILYTDDVENGVAFAADGKRITVDTGNLAPGYYSLRLVVSADGYDEKAVEAGKLCVKPPHLADVQFEVLMDDAPLAEGSRVPQGKVFRVNVLSPDLDVGETYVAELVSDSDSLKFPAKEGERFIVVDTGAVPGGTYSVRVTVSAPDYDETKSLTGVGFTLLALETPKVSVDEKDRRLNHGDTADIRVENADLGLGERYRLELYTGEGEAERVAAAFDWDPATRAFHLETADICGRESCMSEWHATRASMAGSCAPSTTLRARCAPRFSKR